MPKAETEGKLIKNISKKRCTCKKNQHEPLFNKYDELTHPDNW